MTFYLPVHISVAFFGLHCRVSIFEGSDFIFLTFIFTIPIPFTVIPQHVIISSSTASDIQHFLKPFRITSEELHCHDVTIH